MAADPKRLTDRLQALRADRLLHENVWRECFDYSLPALGSGFNGSDPFTSGDIQQRKAKLLDGTAADGVVTGADGFMGGITPANSRWFAMEVDRQTEEERHWLDDCSETIFENIHASNFDAEAHDGMKYLQGAGWFVLFIDAADEGGFYFENWPISQCYLASARQGGRVDTVYRKFEMTVSAMAEEYGESSLSPKSRELLKDKPDTKLCVLHVIEPRRDYLPGAAFAGRLPWASVHLEVDQRHVLREGGFHEFPCAIPRWSRIPGSVYALGPMSDALPDVKSLNEVKRWEFAAAETAIAPPMVAEDDGVLNPRQVKLGPRKIIVANSVDSIKPLITGARIDFGQMIVADLQQAVRRYLMADLFSKLLDDPRMTATQVHAIVGVLRQRMGPRFGRLQSEYLQPLVERCFGIALRAGVLGPPPDSLRNREYTVRYLSPLARAQKLEEVSAIQSHEADLLAIVQANPTAADTYDWDAGQRLKAELRGVPAKLIPDEKAVAAVRKQREDAAQQQQQQQVQLMAQAEAAKGMATNMAGA